uniref:Uncharacterized protein LOC104226061 n=2 Tax=Nicotiana sylvestris TaxID=4096 RepID=A0A1U7W8B0_NICSY|nr:PREDICTED: uncharacterized protein LOC104226061 [Nicotiana sylvestris]
MEEYEASILGLKLAIDMNIQELLVIGDSDLPVHQVHGEWATKNTKILSYMYCVHDLIKRFTKMEFKHVPRVQNELADALATLSSMIQHPEKNFIDPIPMEKGEYLRNATLTQKRTLRRLANQFFQRGGILYRSPPELGLLRCVDAKEASRLLEEIHARTCRPYMNRFILAKKILRAGYFWMTVETDCIKYVQKFHECQVHAGMIRVSPKELNATSSPWPFSAWGTDVIRPIELAGSNRHIFILVAIDYFTKCVKDISYKVVTKKVIANFIRDRIICRFGVLESIITDNAANLNSDFMKAVCKKFKIKHQNSVAYRSQMNRVVEAANKNIKKILRKMVDNYKQWHEKLPLSLFG